MDHIAVLVGEDLHLDVLGLLEVFFDEDVVVAEGLAGLVLHQLVVLAELLVGVGAAHAPAAAAGCRLKQHRIAGLPGDGDGLLHIGHRGGAAGDHRHAAGPGHLLGVELIPHLVQHRTGRADEDEARLLTGAGEVGVFREEAVARVDGVDLLSLGKGDDLLDAEIGPERAAVFADEVGLVRFGAEEGQLILLGIDGDGAHPGVKAGAEHPDGDFAPVGDQHLADLFLHNILPCGTNAASRPEGGGVVYWVYDTTKCNQKEEILQNIFVSHKKGGCLAGF